ncbi:hypothetical protein ES705_50056 [subsurface metagenome]
MITKPTLSFSMGSALDLSSFPFAVSLPLLSSLASSQMISALTFLLCNSSTELRVSILFIFLSTARTKYVSGLAHFFLLNRAAASFCRSGFFEKCSGFRMTGGAIVGSASDTSLIM